MKLEDLPDLKLYITLYPDETTASAIRLFDQTIEKLKTSRASRIDKYLHIITVMMPWLSVMEDNKVGETKDLRLMGTYAVLSALMNFFANIDNYSATDLERYLNNILIGFSTMANYDFIGHLDPGFDPEFLRIASDLKEWAHCARKLLEIWD